jgi:hypothetical protein
MKSIQIVKGSLADTSAKSKTSLAESFIDAEAIILLDISGSMNAHDSRDGLSRYQAACEELAHLQASHPGKLAVIEFNNIVQFVPGGKPHQPYGGTDLAGALKFAKLTDVPEMTFFVISDGIPDSEYDALAVAKTIKAKINTIYVGPENGSGQRFLEKLAKAACGQFAVDHSAMKLAETTERLLLKP